jgi:hypothetical protein
MPRYDVFGGILDSEIEIPELRSARSPTAGTTWTFRVRAGQPPVHEPASILARDEIGGGVEVTLIQVGGGRALVHADTGHFHIAEGGRAIEWYPAAGAPVELARLDLIGRVLATALQLMGAVCLHASAVDVGGRAIAFLAPKGYGKTTTAVALTYAGARLITDDTLAVFPAPTPTCVPGVQSARLRRDSAARFDRTRTDPLREGGEGRVVDAPPPELIMTRRAPLAALYILSPANAARIPAVERRLLPPVTAAMSILSHVKVGALQGRNEAVANLDRATGLAATVPVYSLMIARDLSRLDSVVSKLLEWHGDRRAGVEAAGVA